MVEYWNHEQSKMSTNLKILTVSMPEKYKKLKANEANKSHELKSHFLPSASG